MNIAEKFAAKKASTCPACDGKGVLPLNPTFLVKPVRLKPEHSGEKCFVCGGSGLRHDGTEAVVEAYAMANPHVGEAEE